MKFRFGLVLCLSALTCLPAIGDEATVAESGLVDSGLIVSSAAGSHGPSLDSLRTRLTDSELSDEEKKPLLELLTRAESENKEATAKQKRAEAFRSAIQSLATRCESTKAELQKLRIAKVEPVTSSDLSELETQLASLEVELGKAKQAVADAESTMAGATQHRRDFETELSTLEKQLAERQSEISAHVSPSDNALLGEIQRAELLASEAVLKATIEVGKAESALIDAETSSGQRQRLRDLRVRKLEILGQQHQAVAKAVEEARVWDAQQRVQSAENQLSTLHPSLKPIGEKNRELARRNQELAGLIDEAQEVLSRRLLRVEELQGEYEQAKTRVESVGLTNGVGAMLRNLKQGLPSISAYRLRVRERQSLINDAQYTLIELTDQRNVRLDIGVATLLRNATPPIAEFERAEFETEARRLLETQRAEFLDPAIRNQTTYFNTLVSLSAAELQVVQVSEQALQFVNERILWIQSSQPLTSHLVPSTEEWWFVLPVAWKKIAEKLPNEILSNLAYWSIVLLVFLVLLQCRSRFRRFITKLSQQVSSASCTQFLPTVKVLLMTVATAAPVPLLLEFISRRFGMIAGSDCVLLAFTQACHHIAIGYFAIDLLRQVCRPHGLAEAHLQWRPAMITRLRGGLRLALIATIPFVFASSFLSAGNSLFGNDTLERYFYLAALIVIGLFVTKMLHPRKGLPASYLRENPTGWAAKTQLIWYPVSILVPIALTVLAIIGYYFTSQQLAGRLFASLCLAGGIVLIVSVVMRWVMVNRRRLRIEQARSRRESDNAAGALAEVSIADLEESPEMLQLQMQQTRRLLHTAVLGIGLFCGWMIWDDMIPALGFLEQWPLWNSTRTITENIASPTGVLTTSLREVPDPVTIADLVLASLIVVVTFAATRNLPGLLEFAILRRLPLDKSVRYAITSLASYAIVMLGLVLGGQTIGMHWSQIQWMATALTFGLAFGLQEMFANFIAGIIILFEQPVRVGDVVEIDGVTGVVSQIRIRATTITNWDRKDYIVPNKEFITGKLLNWTRSDEITRIVIKVGIAYGSNTELARDLLLQAAEEHPDVLRDPPAMAMFEGFGDNNLNFSLRVFVGLLEKRFHVTHDLHMAIDKAFRSADIEISFPQHDIHIRTIPEPLRQFLSVAENSGKVRFGSGAA